MSRTPAAQAQPRRVAPPAEAGRSGWDRALLGGLLLLVFLLGLFPAWDFDFWWHLRTGQLIWQNGAVPRADWFTYTAPDAPWIDLQWLFELALAGLYALGGVSLVTVVKALCGALTVALPLGLARPRTLPGAVAVLLWIGPAIVLTGRLYERPEAPTLFFLAAFLAVAHAAADRPRLLWALPAIELVWVNTHGLFVLGPAVLAMLWVDRGLAALRPTSSSWTIGPGGADRAAYAPRALLGPTLATGAACLANPYFLRGALFPLELFRKIGGDDGFYRRAIGELQGIGDFLFKHGPFASPYLALFLLAAVLAVVSFGLTLAKGRVSVFRLLLFAAFFWLGWQAKRNSGLFALVTATVTLWNAGDAFALFRAPGKRSATSRATSAPAASRAPVSSLAPVSSPALRGAAAVALAITAIGVVNGSFYDVAGEGRTFGLGERADWFPHEAARFMARPGMPDRALCFELGAAAVYLFHNGPARKVFIDPRLEVAPRPVFERFLAMMRGAAAGDPAWTDGLGTSDPVQWPALLVARGRTSAMLRGLLSDARWRPVYADAAGVVFLPVAKADALKLPAVRP